MIWNLNLPSSRLVQIRCGTTSIDALRDSHAPLRSADECRSNATVPTNLHVCHESRTETLKQYNLCFGIARNEGRIFFDLERDMLYFGARDGYMATVAQIYTFLSLGDPNDLNRVRRIAINDAVFWDGRVGDDAAAENLTAEIVERACSRMPRLETISFVLPDDNPIYDDRIKLVQPSTRQWDMETRIHSAFEHIFHQTPGHRPIKWQVMTLGTAQSDDHSQDKASKLQHLRSRTGSPITRSKFSSEESTFVAELQKSHAKFRWPEIHRQFVRLFPWRSKQSLQMHFCRKLKRRVHYRAFPTSTRHDMIVVGRTDTT